MRTFIAPNILKKDRRSRTIGCVALICSASFFRALGQSPSASAPTAPSESQQPQAPVTQVDPGLPPPITTGFATTVKADAQPGDSSSSETQIKDLLVGKTLYLRGDYLDNNLSFDERGHLASQSTRGSYTLCAIKINKAKFSKHKIELEGDRYALRFHGELPHQDPLNDVARVKITPKKKVVRITIARELAEKPKKEKSGDKKKDDSRAPVTQIANASSAPANPAGNGSAASQPFVSDTPSASSRHLPTTEATDPPAKASKSLLDALDRIFARDIDNRMIFEMPDFWRLYYEAAASNTDYAPTDPGVYRQNTVDAKAKLTSTIDPPSNELAQSNGVAGMALYHAIVGSDGKISEVVAGRPIGFGLDESAVESIRRASFEPATKDGKPVPVALDLVVSFRIYSNRTSTPTVKTADTPSEPVLPGPYSAQPQ
jgi:Gram-negative bacterial TonB protein C-terminal